jgi:hypothetical protein
MLNSDKCVLGVYARKLLGFLVLHRRIEANPDKDVQKLKGCLAALSQFISRLAEWALSFFLLLRKFGPFVWTEEAYEMFQELK